MIRLTGKVRESAKTELLHILREKGPQKTGDLIGTLKFHGGRTLSLKQVRTLLQNDLRDQVQGKFVPGGLRYSTTIWRLREIAAV